MRPVIVLLAMVSFLFSSCFDILEDIILKKDGSGEYTYTIDMSELYKNEMLSSMMQMNSKEGENSNPLPDMDTMMYGKDIPANYKGDNPALWDRVQTHMLFNKEKKKALITVHLDFEKLSDIAYLMKNMDKAMGESNKGGNSAMESNPIAKGAPAQYILKGKTLTRISEPMKQTEEEDESLAMMKMFMMDAKYRVVYHLPGTVKSTTIEGAVQEGKDVKTSMSFLDLMEGKQYLDGVIKYK